MIALVRMIASGLRYIDCVYEKYSQSFCVLVTCSLLGSMSVILVVLAKHQWKSAKVLNIYGILQHSYTHTIAIKPLLWFVKVHPIFALAVSDVLLSSLWFLGGSAWMAQLGHRELCFAISLLTIVSPKITRSIIDVDQGQLHVHRFWSVSLLILFLCMLWLPTLELETKTRKQSWQV